MYINLYHVYTSYVLLDINKLHHNCMQTSVYMYTHVQLKWNVHTTFVYAQVSMYTLIRATCTHSYERHVHTTFVYNLNVMYTRHVRATFNVGQ